MDARTARELHGRMYAMTQEATRNREPSVTIPHSLAETIMNELWEDARKVATPSAPLVHEANVALKRLRVVASQPDGHTYQIRAGLVHDLIELLTALRNGVSEDGDDNG